MKQARISSLVSLFPLPQYVVVLEDLDKSHLVPIWIGVSEGNAIALEMNGEKFPRPLTHDLIVNILEQVGAKIEKVVITDIKDNSYFAEIEITANGKTQRIDARPSDSLAIAVRNKCPIFIETRVLDKCPTVDKPISEQEVEHFKEQLKSMTPAEFFNKLEATPGKKKDLENVFGPIQIDEEGEEGEEDDEEEGEEGEEGEEDEGVR